MAIPIVPTIISTGGPDVAKRKHNEYMREALSEMGLEWHGKRLPEHFKESAFNRYRYQQRSKGHDEEKLKKYGHRKPIVFTGRTRAQALARGDAKATPSRVTVGFSIPTYAYQLSRRRKKPVNVEKELQTVTNKEAADLAKTARDKYVEQLNNEQEQVTRRV